MSKDKFSDDGSYEAYVQAFGDPQVITIPLELTPYCDPRADFMRRITGSAAIKVVYEGQNLFNMHLFTGTPDELYDFVRCLFQSKHFQTRS